MKTKMAIVVFLVFSFVAFGEERRPGQSWGITAEISEDFWIGTVFRLSPMFMIRPSILVWWDSENDDVAMGIKSDFLFTIPQSDSLILYLGPGIYTYHWTTQDYIPIYDDQGFFVDYATVNYNNIRLALTARIGALLHVVKNFGLYTDIGVRFGAQFTEDYDVVEDAWSLFGFTKSIGLGAVIYLQ